MFLLAFLSSNRLAKRLQLFRNLLPCFEAEHDPLVSVDRHPVDECEPQMLLEFNRQFLHRGDLFHGLCDCIGFSIANHGVFCPN